MRTIECLERSRVHEKGHKVVEAEGRTWLGLPLPFRMGVLPYLVGAVQQLDWDVFVIICNTMYSAVQ